MSLGLHLKELRWAMILLTRLPMGRIEGEVLDLRAAGWAFPVVGLATGTVGWGVHSSAMGFGIGSVLAAILTVGVLVLITGALHLDGLADFADGIGGGPDRERRLEIMRDSRIGSYGVIALIFAIGIQVAALAQMDLTVPMAAFLLAGVASRLAMLALLVLLAPARDEGLGQSAAGGGGLAIMPGVLIVFALVASIGLAAYVAIVLASLAAAVVGFLAQRNLGGQTGDVLGTGQVVAECAIWIVISVMLLG